MKSLDQRVVITGIGIVSPNGIGRARYWKGLTEGYNAIRRIPVSTWAASRARWEAK
jgi:3-oxoacyl-(acyl-carrier-protein) synthase